MSDRFTLKRALGPNATLVDLRDALSLLVRQLNDLTLLTDVKQDGYKRVGPQGQAPEELNFRAPFTITVDLPKNRRNVDVDLTSLLALITASNNFDANASYYVRSLTASLPNAATLVPGDNVSFVIGANTTTISAATSSYHAGNGLDLNATVFSIDNDVVATVSGTTFTGVVNAPRLSGSLQRLTTGEAFLAGQGGVTVTTSSNGQVVISGSAANSYFAGTGLFLVGNTFQVNDSIVATVSGTRFTGPVTASLGQSIVGDLDFYTPNTLEWEANFTSSSTGLKLSTTKPEAPATLREFFSVARNTAPGVMPGIFLGHPTETSFADIRAQDFIRLFVNNRIAITITGSALPVLTSSIPAVFRGGLTGSLMRLESGASYLVAQGGVSITSQSNGQVLISGSLFNGIQAGTGITVAGTTVSVDPNLVVMRSGSSMTGPLVLSGGLTGSLQRLVNGQTFIAGQGGISVTTSSAGQVIVSGSGENNYFAGTGLRLASNTFSINDGVVATVSGTTFTGPVSASAGLSGSLQRVGPNLPYLLGQGGISIATQSNGQILISGSGDSTYSAGTGLRLVGTTFSINDNVVATVSGTRFTGPVDASPAGLTGSITGSNAQFNGFVTIGGQFVASAGAVRLGNGGNLGAILATLANGTNANLISIASDNVVSVASLEAAELDLNTKAVVDINISGSGVPRHRIGASSLTLDVTNAAQSGLLRVSGNLGTVLAARNFDATGDTALLAQTGNATFSDLFLGDDSNKGISTDYVRAKLQVILRLTGSNEFIFNSTSSDWQDNQFLNASLVSGTAVSALTLTGSLTQLNSGQSYLVARGGVSITSQSNGQVVISGSNDTTYVAGTGLRLVGTTFSINDNVVATVSGTSFTGPVVAGGGLSGSLQRLPSGPTFLAGQGAVVITTSSNGQVVVSGSGDTTYVAGTGLRLVSTTFSINDNVVATVSGTRFTGPVDASLAGLTGSLTGSTVQLGSFISFGQLPAASGQVRLPNGGAVNGRRTDGTTINMLSLGADNVVSVGATEAQELDLITKSNLDVNVSGTTLPTHRFNSTGLTLGGTNGAGAAATAGVLRVSGNVGNVLMAKSYDNSTNTRMLSISGDATFSDMFVGDDGNRGVSSLYHSSKLQTGFFITGTMVALFNGSGLSLSPSTTARDVSGVNRFTGSYQQLTNFIGLGLASGTLPNIGRIRVPHGGGSTGNVISGRSNGGSDVNLLGWGTDITDVLTLGGGGASLAGIIYNVGSGGSHTFQVGSTTEYTLGGSSANFLNPLVFNSSPAASGYIRFPSGSADLLVVRETSDRVVMSFSSVGPTVNVGGTTCDTTILSEHVLRGKLVSTDVFKFGDDGEAYIHGFNVGDASADTFLVRAAGSTASNNSGGQLRLAGGRRSGTGNYGGVAVVLNQDDSTYHTAIEATCVGSSRRVVGLFGSPNPSTVSSGDQVVYLGDCATPPSLGASALGGGVDYAHSGSRKFQSSGGLLTTMAPVGAHPGVLDKHVSDLFSLTDSTTTTLISIPLSNYGSSSNSSLFVKVTVYASGINGSNIRGQTEEIYTSVRITAGPTYTVDASVDRSWKHQLSSGDRVAGSADVDISSNNLRVRLGADIDGEGVPGPVAAWCVVELSRLV